MMEEMEKGNGGKNKRTEDEMREESAREDGEAEERAISEAEDGEPMIC